MMSSPLAGTSCASAPDCHGQNHARYEVMPPQHLVDKLTSSRGEGQGIYRLLKTERMERVLCSSTKLQSTQKAEDMAKGSLFVQQKKERIQGDGKGSCTGNPKGHIRLFWSSLALQVC